MTLMYPKLGLTRNVLRRNYALITPDGYVPSVLPGWSGGAAFVILSAALGAKVTQILVDLEAAGTGSGETGDAEYFFYLVTGQGTCNGTELGSGGYAFVPANVRYDFTSTRNGTRLLIFRKTFEPLPDSTLPAFLTGREQDVPEVPFLGDPRARLKTLLPDSPGMDMAVNLFTYDPGATLPFVETHVMEHGILFLDGGGVYRLDEDWHPVTAGDSLWIAPYCPQWFIAAGPQPARYIYYKDVNRTP
jgi:(S)-ureidoglycine aminohydrolase